MGGAPAPGWRRRRREARGLAVPPGPAVALPPLPPPPPRGRRRSFRRYPLSAPPPGPALRRSRAERRSVPTCRRRARAPPPGPAAARGAPQRPARARCRAAGPWRRAAVTRVLGRGRAAAGGSGAPGAALGPAPCPAPLRSAPSSSRGRQDGAGPSGLPPRPGVSHRRPALSPPLPPSRPQPVGPVRGRVRRRCRGPADAAAARPGPGERPRHRPAAGEEGTAGRGRPHGRWGRRGGGRAEVAGPGRQQQEGLRGAYAAPVGRGHRIPSGDASGP